MPGSDKGSGVTGWLRREGVSALRLFSAGRRHLADFVLISALALVPAAAWSQPLADGELGWLVRESDERPAREARLLPPPERFTLISRDGNFVPPLEQRGEEAKLMDAARRADIPAVRALLKAGANPNIGDIWRDTPLNEAARQENLELAQILLDAGAVPNTKGRGHTPLGLAARNGNVRLVEMLLRAGADPERRGDDGDFPIHGAVRAGHASVVTLLLNARPDLRHFDREGLSPLALASVRGDERIAAMLLDAGAPMEWGDRQQRSPLWWAVYRNQQDMARFLVKRGAKIGTMSVEEL